MNNKHMLTLLLALCLCIVLCACGKSNETKPSTTESSAPAESTEESSAPEESTEDSSMPEEEPVPEESEPAAEPQTMAWGAWTVDVPAGFELKGGDVFDETDLRYFSVKKSAFVFFDFKAEGEDRIMSNYDYNKNTYTNEQTDVQGTFGSSEWTGFQYSDGFGGFGFEAYTTVDGEMIRVSAAGYPFDDPMVDAILSSLHYDSSAVEEEESSEAPEETSEEVSDTLKSE